LSFWVSLYRALRYRRSYHCGHNSWRAFGVALPQSVPAERSRDLAMSAHDLRTGLLVLAGAVSGEEALPGS
jgi:hypothetical protein